MDMSTGVVARNAGRSKATWEITSRAKIAVVSCQQWIQAQMPKKQWWKWVCEFCFKKSNLNDLPDGWDLVWDCAVCPNCQKSLEKDSGHAIVKGGAYAKKGRRDPRAS